MIQQLIEGVESDIDVAHFKVAPLLSVGLRYALISGAAYFIFYVWKKNRYHCAKIQWRYPENKDVLREIFYSTVTLLIFGASISFVAWADYHRYSWSYPHISDYGWAYFFLSIVLMIFAHDAYFYFMHRLLHWKPLFRTVHKIHHQSINPTPFAAFAFHPVEGVINGAIFPIVAFIIPHQNVAILAFGTYSILLNVMGHVGFEFFPKYFSKHWLFKWHNSATHHNMHHSHVKCNFGLYFNIWDRLLNTNHPDYEARFDKVITIREEAQIAQLEQTGIVRKVKVKELVVPEPHQPEQHTVSA